MASCAASAKRCRGGSRGTVEDCSAARWWGKRGAGGGGRGQHRVGGLGPRAPSRQGWGAPGLSFFHSPRGLFPWRRKRGEGREREEEEEERHGGRVGRPTTPPGACPESARILYRARLITSRGVPRWFTAANFSADRPNHRPLTHFCALVLPERTLGLHGRTIVVKVKRSRIISLENNYC